MFSRRFIQLAIIATIGSVLLPAAGYAAKKGGAQACANIPVWITIMPVDGSVLADDGREIYKDGGSGVVSKIYICGSEPTYDARTDFPNSTRSVGFTFPHANEGSNVNGPAPIWAGAGTFQSKPIVYVRNILWGRMHGQTTFTTRVIIKSIKGPGDAALYDLRLQPSLVDALLNDPPMADTNIPEQTATVTVQDIPGDCRQGGTTRDAWIVTADAPFIGTLYKQASRKTPNTHAGQYTVPFKLYVEAQSCVPASLTP